MFFNIATREEFPTLYQRMFENFGAFRKSDRYSQVHPSNMFIGYVVRLMLLAREREQSRLITECKHTFANMAKSTNTIWELFAENASCNHGFGSITAKLICEALTGYIGTDKKEKKVCFMREFMPVNACLKLPIHNGSVNITVFGSERKIEIPDGYRIEIK